MEVFLPVMLSKLIHEFFIKCIKIMITGRKTNITNKVKIYQITVSKKKIG
jgi:hypothetical protein